MTGNVRDLSDRLPRRSRADAVAEIRAAIARPDLTLEDLLEGPLDALADPGQYGPVVGSTDAIERLAAITDALTTVSRVPFPTALEALRILLDELDQGADRAS